jgi:hypothetical protein
MKDSAELTSPPPPVFTGESPFASRIALWQRLLLISAGVVLVALLVTAAILKPDRAGIGTHQQLGLPPCSFIMLFGTRCPACGMTTSWSHLMHGQPLQSAQANSGGMLLAIISLTMGPWMLISGVLGRWWLGAIHPAWLAGGAGLVFTVTAAQWLWRVLL